MVGQYLVRHIHAPVLRIFNSISISLGIDNQSTIHFLLFTTLLVVLSHFTNELCNWLRLRIEKNR